jgi:nucleoside-diphosphate-sugar epimerase
MRCLVTGASGFIGGHLCQHLLRAGHAVKAACSTPESAGLLQTCVAKGQSLECVKVERFSTNPAAWKAACANVDTLFHLAGYAHRSEKPSPKTRETCFRANLDVTQALALAAIEMGVRHFIFASSVTVYGSHSVPGMAFREDSPPAPAAHDFYALAKQEAEDFLQRPEIRSSMATSLIRLPLVYGSGVKGNLLSLLRLVACGWPLPLAGIANRRSLIGIDNLMDFLDQVAQNPASHDRVLLCSDAHDVSTPEIIRAIAQGLGQPPRLFAMPDRILRIISRLSGQSARYKKLCASFQIDPTMSMNCLNWRPSIGFAEGMARMCRGYPGQDHSLRAP